MIVNWAVLPGLQSRWKYDMQLFLDAVSALDTALSQQEVTVTLTGPDYEILARPQPTGAWDIKARQAAMLGYHLTEQTLSAHVRIIP